MFVDTIQSLQHFMTVLAERLTYGTVDTIDIDLEGVDPSRHGSLSILMIPVKSAFCQADF